MGAGVDGFAKGPDGAIILFIYLFYQRLKGVVVLRKCNDSDWLSHT